MRMSMSSKKFGVPLGVDQGVGSEEWEVIEKIHKLVMYAPFIDELDFLSDALRPDIDFGHLSYFEIVASDLIGDARKEWVYVEKYPIVTVVGGNLSRDREYEYLKKLEKAKILRGISDQFGNQTYWFIVNKSRFKELYEGHGDYRDAKTTATGISSNRLRFSEGDGVTVYRSAQTDFMPLTKTRALLTVLGGSKNVPFDLRMLIERCNVTKFLRPNKFFKGQKDVDDALSAIRKKLKVKKSEYFPVQREGNTWKWSER